MPRRPAHADMFTFVLDGPRPRMRLSSGWQRRKRQLDKGRVEDFGELDRLVLAEARDACRRRAKITGYAWDVDHMVPLERGGAHAYYNLQVIPACLNAWKGKRLVLTEVAEYAQYLPGGSGLFEVTK